MKMIAESSVGNKFSVKMQILHH